MTLTELHVASFARTLAEQGLQLEFTHYPWGQLRGAGQAVPVVVRFYEHSAWLVADADRTACVARLDYAEGAACTLPEELAAVGLAPSAHVGALGAA